MKYIFFILTIVSFLPFLIAPMGIKAGGEYQDTGTVLYLPVVAKEESKPHVSVIFGTHDSEEMFVLSIIGYVTAPDHVASLDIEVDHAARRIYLDVVSDVYSPPEGKDVPRKIEAYQWVPFFQLEYKVEFMGYVLFVNDYCVLPQIGCHYTR